MRKTTMISLAAGAIALGLMLPGAGVNAMPAAAGLAAASRDAAAVQEVAYVCRRVWTGSHWRRHCYWVGPRHYYGPRHYRYRHWRRW